MYIYVHYETAFLFTRLLRGGVVVERSPRMREIKIKVRYSVGTDLISR